jgi:hypothetical protein
MSHGDGLDRLRQALEEHGCTVRGSAAQCPAPDHDDRNASLSVGQGRDGAVLKCHAGCATDVILEALGMSAGDLFDELRGGSHERARVTAQYEYTDEHGQLLFVKERRVPKDFRLRRPDGRGGWIWSLGDTPRVLYKLPAVLAAVASGQPVYVAEGEKDADAIGRAGAVATCNFEGAAKDGQQPKWRPEYGNVLKGARVIVVADKDPAGYAHAAAIRADLEGKAASVEVVEAAEGNDAADHLAAGHALGDFRPAGRPLTRLDELRGQLLDSAALDSLPDPEPLIDGVLFRDSLAWLHGKPGHGKSFVALDWSGCIATGLPWQDSPVTAGHVLYVIAEGVSGLRQRVRAWEDYTGQRMGVRFLPVAVQLLSTGDVSAVIELARELKPVLIVIDTQARVTVGGDENSAKDMGELVAAADRIRQASRACVLLVHHEARAGENMRGSTALEGAATTLVRVTKDGSQLTIENTKQKDLTEFDTIRLHLAPRLDSAVCMPLDSFALAAELTDSEQKIVDTLRESFGDVAVAPTKLLEVSKVAKSSFYRAVRQLVATGRILNTGTSKRPQYLLPEFAGGGDEG